MKHQRVGNASPARPFQEQKGEKNEKTGFEAVVFILVSDTSFS